MKDIFISYNWESKEVVKKIVDSIKSKNGYQVWMDESVMRSGDKFRKEIQEGIDNCKIFIAFITQKYCESSNCQSETHYAFDKKKKCIYVMLEKNFGKDPTGISLIVASSLRLNAYQFMNEKDWTENLYNMLSRDINQHLNDQELPKLVLQKIDLESLIKCRVCENRFNLEENEKENCRKPMQTNCHMHKLNDNVMCLKCIKDRKRINSLRNETFLCPFDGNEHPLSNCTDANRLHNIITYFETKNYFENLKKNAADYDYLKNETKTKLIDQVNETKRKIEEHVQEIINELNYYVAQMVFKIEMYAESWLAEQEKVKEFLKLDKIIQSTNDSVIQLENDLKQIEISVKGNDFGLIDKHVKENNVNIRNINDTIKKTNEQIGRESVKLRNKIDFSYKKGNKINDLKEVVGILVNDIPELLALCGTEENNYLRIKEIVEQQNPNVNFKNNDGYTALFLASKYGHFETVKFLVKNGADINQKVIYGSTALIGASYYGHLNIVQFLVQNGANIDEKNDGGCTALFYAKRECINDVYDYLKSKSPL